MTDETKVDYAAINQRGLRYDEAVAVAKATIGICPALVLEGKRRADGLLGYHICANRTHPECKPYCGVHRLLTHHRKASEEMSYD